MRLYLSAVFESPQLRRLIKQGKKNEYEDLIRGTHILASFAYHRKGHEEYYPLAKSLLFKDFIFVSNLLSDKEKIKTLLHEVQH